MEDGIIYRGENESIKNAVSQAFKDEQLRLSKESGPIPEKLQQFAADARKYMVEEWFAKMGISGQELPPAPAIYNVLLSEEVGEASLAIGVKIDLNHFLNAYSDKDMCEYMEARTLLEEIYHYTAKPVITTGSQNKPVTMESGGLTFYKSKNRYPQIEEGMAQLFIDHASGFLEKHFPAGHQKIEAIRSSEGNLFLVSSKNSTNTLRPLYPGATILTKEIVDNALGGDCSLIEKARIRRDHLPLARKLKEVYGEDVYRPVMLATENGAALLANQLKKARVGE
ncbi:hypothetical protein C4564_03360 [Candidatus Microgenomates bacterium]|nr:MAG: hypothetical protein C4564_03360 [Candidatus Microgenomates bacterium]